MRWTHNAGVALLVVDTIENARYSSHADRPAEFSADLAFNRGSDMPTTPSMSAIAGELPQNVRLMTVADYKEWNQGKYVLRVAHMYQVDDT